jgi:hypothetical protein
MILLNGLLAFFPVIFVQGFFFGWIVYLISGDPVGRDMGWIAGLTAWLSFPLGLALSRMLGREQTPGAGLPWLEKPHKAIAFSVFIALTYGWVWLLLSLPAIIIGGIVYGLAGHSFIAGLIASLVVLVFGTYVVLNIFKRQMTTGDNSPA